MDKKFLKRDLGWGVLLWVVGYVLGIGLYMWVPQELLGWYITPIGVALTLWVLFRKIEAADFASYFRIGVIWSVMAVILDYLFLVQLFKPEDGYYKADVYVYYLLTLTLPWLVGWKKTRGRTNI